MVFNLAIQFQNCGFFVICFVFPFVEVSPLLQLFFLSCPSFPCLIMGITFALPVLPLLSHLGLFLIRCSGAVLSPQGEWSWPKGGEIFVKSAKSPKVVLYPHLDVSFRPTSLDKPMKHWAAVGCSACMGVTCPLCRNMSVLPVAPSFHHICLLPLITRLIMNSAVHKKSLCGVGPARSSIASTGMMTVF